MLRHSTVDSVIRHTIVRHTLAYRILGADSPIVVLAGVNPSIRHSLLYGIAHLDSRGACRKAELTVQAAKSSVVPASAT